MHMPCTASDQHGQGVVSDSCECIDDHLTAEVHLTDSTSLAHVPGAEHGAGDVESVSHAVLLMLYPTLRTDQHLD